MGNSDYRRVEQAIHFLEQHAIEQPSLDEVAEAIGLSPFHFQRLFKRWAGVSPKQFLQYLTLQSAKQRLRASAPLLDTALDVGLSGPGRLHDLFVKIEAATPGQYKQKGRGLELRYGFHPTLFGDCLVATSERGLCHLSFDDDDPAAARDYLLQQWPAATLIEDPTAGANIVSRIFSSKPVSGDVPLRLLLHGTNFQVKVWEALLRIPEGAITSYGALADAIGHPGASRAIGTAIGCNPIAYLIPCHRVLQASGTIGGYRWGTTRKKAMLAREAATTPPLVRP